MRTNERNHVLGAIPAFATSAIGLVGEITLGITMLLISLDVLMRWAFNAPIRGVTEITAISVVALVFSQMARVAAERRFARSDTFLSALEEHRPRAAAVILCIADLGGAVVFATVAERSFGKTIVAFERGYYTGTPGIFTVPEWPLFGFILLACTLTVLQFLLLLATDVAMLANGKTRQKTDKEDEA